MRKLREVHAEVLEKQTLHLTKDCRAKAKIMELTSMIFLFVNDSCGSLYSVYLSKTLSISVLAYWYNLLLLENIINAISQSHNTESS